MRDIRSKLLLLFMDGSYWSQGSAGEKPGSQGDHGQESTIQNKEDRLQLVKCNSACYHHTSLIKLSFKLPALFLLLHLLDDHAFANGFVHPEIGADTK